MTCESTLKLVVNKEKCGDNLDDDCGDKVDALTRSCYTGPSGTQGKGICKAGTQTCPAGRWLACSGQILPKMEIAGNGIDEDCDGRD